MKNERRFTGQKIHESVLSRILVRILVFQTVAILECRYFPYDFITFKVDFLEQRYSKLLFHAASLTQIQFKHAPKINDCFEEPSK